MHSWSTMEYVAVTFIYSWMLRIGEATLKAETAHTVMWSMVRFKIKIPRGGMREMQGRELRTTPCDMVELHMDTRKHQELAREMPGRTNMRRIEDPSQGATTWQGMCQATMLQGWALLCDLDKKSPEWKAARPVLAHPGEALKPMTPYDVNNALQRQVRRDPERSGRMSAHVLRHNGITAVANSKTPVPEAALLALTGHTDLKTTKGYIHPGPEMARQSTLALTEQDEHA
mmetsp:Transcript_24223/g.45056  ORF Transcript_24223/g.45056 Transcript_24223/m.45056 type:complete len:230 (-) Transcript_24223:184-873(-)